MSTRVDLTALTVAEVDDLFHRAAAGEDPTRLLAEANRRRIAHLLAAATIGRRHPVPPVFAGGFHA